MISEDDILVSCPKPVRYIQAVEEVLETSFQSLEIISTAYVEMGPKKDKPTNAMITTTKIMLKEGYRLGSLKAPRNLYENFISGGYANQVEETTEDQEVGDPNNFVQPCTSQENVGNWTLVELPVILDPNSKNQRGTPEELKRLVELGDKIIQPYQEGIQVIDIGNGGSIREVKIVTTMYEDTKKELIHLLAEYMDIFAWTYQDMPQLDSKIVEHKLPLKPDHSTVKQKLKRMRPKVLLKIKEEVKKQLEVGFLVPVLKKDGKVRMCMDYRDLNQARLKMIFPYLI
ncbi:hypothetical protein CR513_31854, partial [Mucuna pruriens]